MRWSDPGALDTFDRMQRCADVSDAALREIGRADLAALVVWFANDDGSPYLEPMDELAGADLVLMERAEALALASVTP